MSQIGLGVPVEVALGLSSTWGYSSFIHFFYKAASSLITGTWRVGKPDA